MSIEFCFQLKKPESKYTTPIQREKNISSNFMVLQMNID